MASLRIRKFHTTQVVLALATTSDGLPVGYKLFSGNTAEVSTLLACLDEWRRTLAIGQVIFVGDRGMMSEKNLQALEQAGVTYVFGAKLRKMPGSVQQKILGIHGVITNAKDSQAQEILAHYSRLWVIEDSFRIQKHHLSIRPIYHFKPERIEAHILLCYMEFTMIRHFQFRMEKQQSRVTLDEMRHELWRVQAGILQDEITEKWYRIPSAMTPQAKKMYQVFGLKRELQPQELKY